MTVKTEIIRDALHATSNDPSSIATSDDEWLKADRAFERALKSSLVRSKFKFSERSVALVLAAAAEHPDYTYSYNLPVDLIDTRTAYVTESATTGPVKFTNWTVLNDKLCCDYATGVSLLYCYVPPQTQWRDDFVEYLTLKVEAGVYQSVNEDLNEAQRREAMALAALDSAQVTEDQSVPGVKRMNRLRARRQLRGTK